MKIACLGGGPAGLYFAILRKKLCPEDDVVVDSTSTSTSTDPVTGEVVVTASFDWPVTGANELRFAAIPSLRLTATSGISASPRRR